PDSAYRLVIPARLDLELHAAVALRDAVGRQLDGLLHAVLDAEGDADRDLPVAAAEKLVQGQAERPRPQVPESHLDDCHGHVVAAYEPERVEQGVGGVEVLADDGGSDEVTDDVPRRVGGLVGVARELARHALCEARHAVATHRSDEDAAILLHSEAGPEWELEAQ